MGTITDSVGKIRGPCPNFAVRAPEDPPSPQSILFVLLLNDQTVALRLFHGSRGRNNPPNRGVHTENPCPNCPYKLVTNPISVLCVGVWNDHVNRNELITDRFCIQTLTFTHWLNIFTLRCFVLLQTLSLFPNTHNTLPPFVQCAIAHHCRGGVWIRCRSTQIPRFVGKLLHPTHSLKFMNK